MKKKKILITAIICLAVLLGVICFIILKGHNYAYTIMLDINPSIEINLNKEKKVVRVKALNKDAKGLTKNINIKGKNFNEAVNVIRDGIVKHGYTNSDNSVDIVIYSNLENVDNTITDSFKEIDISSNVIVIDKITKEDKKLAKKYDVSPAKIAYLKSVTDDKNDLSVEDIVSSPIRSINETIETGKRCPKGYFLEGEWCYKEVKRTKVKNGLVCPSEYKEYNGKCYKAADLIDTTEYECDDDEVLKGDKCYRTSQSLARYDEFKCENGVRVDCNIINDNGEANTNNCFRCVDESKREYPTYICVKVINGVCYGGAGKPHIDGKCINGDIEYNGKCYEKRQYEYVCKNGGIVKSKNSYCTGDPAITDPTPIYYCDDENATLVGENCIIENERVASLKTICPSGYTLINDDVCINLNISIDKVSGYVCESEFSKVINNECIIYEMVESK